ncbi:Uncharacterized protein FWK35_00024254, partial [Aphis craccivora]
QSNSPPGGVLGIRIAPGPGPAEAPRTRTATFDGRPHAHGRGPRFDARSPQLVLNATGISTAARHKRAQADGAATAPDEPTARRRRDGTTADGRTHPPPEPRVPLYRVSGETMRVVVFQVRRRDGRTRDRPPRSPTPTYATPRHVSEQCQIRVKLNSFGMNHTVAPATATTKPNRQCTHDGKPPGAQSRGAPAREYFGTVELPPSRGTDLDHHGASGCPCTVVRVSAARVPDARMSPKDGPTRPNRFCQLAP